MLLKTPKLGCPSRLRTVFLHQVRPWRPLMVFAALPMAAYLLLWPAVLESPRWLLVAGRKVRMLLLWKFSAQFCAQCSGEPCTK